MASTTSHEASDRQGLTGKRIALARAADEANTPAAELAELGADVVFYPCLELLPPENVVQLDRSLHQLVAGEFDWLVLTTASAAVVLAERLETLKTPVRHIHRVKVAAYGAIARKAAHDLLHVDPDRIPETDTHQELVHAMRLTAGSRVLLPLAAGARTDWADLLKEHGAQVTSVAAYRAMLGHGGHEVPLMLWSGDIDAIAFTSENNVRYFAKRLQFDGGTLAMLDDVCVACIEPQTAAAARAIGLRVDIVPHAHSPEALAAALHEYFDRHAR